MADQQARIAKRKEFEGKLGLKAFELAQSYLVRKDPQGVDEAGAKLGMAIYRMARRRRERALSNIELALPELTLAQRQDMCKEVFRHYGKVTADFLASVERPIPDLVREVEVEGREHLESAYAAGNGVLMISAHLGHWERLSTWFNGSGYKMTVVVRDVRNEQLNKKVNDLRSRAGAPILSRGNAAMGIIKTLRKNEMLGMLPDQSDDEVYVPFFGKPAGTANGVGIVQERTGATIMPSACYYVGPGKYLLKLHAPVEALPGYEEKGVGMTAAVTLKIEQMIRENPTQWLWFHDRWKAARHRGLL